MKRGDDLFNFCCIVFAHPCTHGDKLFNLPQYFFRSLFLNSAVAPPFQICYNSTMFKELLLKNMLQSKLNGFPQAERDKLLNIVEKNPDLFMKIAEETREKMKEGKGEMDAVMEVMKIHREELNGIVKFNE